MAKTLDFFQVYYQEYQREQLYDFATEHYNETLTPYFENSIISELVPKSEADLIAVVSWRLKQKRGTASEMILRRAGIFDLTLERIVNSEFDVAILTPRRPGHDPLAAAVTWHGQAWVDAFAVFKTFLSTDLGIKIRGELSTSIYENHFIAKADLYRQYVLGCSRPAIEFISKEEVFKTPSGYCTKKRQMGTPEKDIQETLGKLAAWYGHPVHDWPIGVFILERLFSIWIQGKGYNVINL